jgi:ArsR family transcriptional regulator
MVTDGLFRAMADSTRRSLLRVLGEHDLTVSELVEVLRLPQSTISRHLKVLREAGFLADHRRGAAVFYSLCPRFPSDTDEWSRAGSNGQNGHNGEPQLRGRLLDWIQETPIDETHEQRLTEVLARRTGGDKDFFNALGHGWDRLRVQAFGEFFQYEALTALLPARWRVADVGTGTGYLLPILAERFSKVIAVDPSQQMLDAARGRLAEAGAQDVEFRLGSLEELPIQPGEVDLIVASLVLHHAADPSNAIAGLYQALAGGGRILIIEQAAHEYQDFQQRMGDRWSGFEPKRLAGWLEEAGFTGVRVLPMTTAYATTREAEPSPELFAVVAEV